MTLPDVPTFTRLQFLRFIEVLGRDFDNVVQDVTGPTGECWTNAWRAHDNKSGHLYVEGYCYVEDRPLAHAWTVDALGVAHEHTLGFDQAHSYRGIVFNTSPTSQARRASDAIFPPSDQRGSLFECALYSGYEASAFDNFAHQAWHRRQWHV